MHTRGLTKRLRFWTVRLLKNKMAEEKRADSVAAAQEMEKTKSSSCSFGSIWLEKPPRPPRW